MSAAQSSRCPFCEASLAERQRWCLQCGGAALTAIASPRRWAATGAAATVVALLALAGIGYAIATVVSS